MSHSITGTVLTALVVGSVACAHEQAPAASPPAAREVVGETQTTSAQVTPRPGITVSEDILKACKLNFDNEKAAPEFCFDQTYLTPPDRDILAKVGECLTTGPLKGRRIHLIGRADPRGEQEYNMTLGSSRAASVATYLQGLGVDPSRMSQTSRGELDATGSSEETWQLDRRVDILLEP